ncbi:hypothetical protein BASA50_010491 [Batrachochytrium salamandrivorans]|uniref:Uncharacterized protein n=1 Tax=Batrachochytrium salamandrivorans TaxID=1357716 RepID=A0ABQ8EZG3_9FUNG|nr:hypothetical protein BASA50_010491 [Batrachochytrium salamandrivorans]
MDSLNTPTTATGTATTTTTTTATTTAVHFSRRARTSRSAGQVPSDIIGEATHTQAQISPKASRKKATSDTKAPATTESSGKPVHFSRRAPTKRTAKPKQVDAPVTKPETCASLPPSQIPRLTTASTIQYEHQPSSKLSLNSRIFIPPRMTKAKPQVDLQNNQSSAREQTFPIHGSVGSALIEDEESIYIDISHKGSTGMDAIAAVASVVHVGADPNGIKIVTNAIRVRNHSGWDHIINPRITIQAKSTSSTRQNNSSNGIRSGTTFIQYINVYRFLILDQRTANTPMYRKRLFTST